MPVNTPDIKVNNVRRLGGLVELVGESYQEAQAYAQVGGGGGGEGLGQGLLWGGMDGSGLRQPHASLSSGSDDIATPVSVVAVSTLV